MTEHTTEKLAAALREVPGVPADMIERALAGYYHDYLSPLAFPEMQLVHDLHFLASLPATPRDSRPRLRDLAAQVVAGDFDASAEEADAWARSPEGQATFRELFRQ